MSKKRISTKAGTAILATIALGTYIMTGTLGDVIRSTPDGMQQIDANSDTELAALLPSSVGNNQIVWHKAFVLSYNDRHEQADWVFYRLTRDMVSGSTERNVDFVEDPDVSNGTATTHDYSRSGYDRGHLCASADIRNDDVAHDETYYMSNMSPQVHEFNAGIWNDLEMQTRAWARKKGTIYVATGPILSDNLEKIEKYKTGRKEAARSHYNGVSVPNEYYKILYCPDDGGHMIAYRLRNEAYDENDYPNKHCVSVDNIEEATGINFFAGVPNEDRLEKQVGGVAWWRN